MMAGQAMATPPGKLHQDALGYHEDDLLTWAEAQRRTSTPEGYDDWNGALQAKAAERSS